MASMTEADEAYRRAALLAQLDRLDEAADLLDPPKGLDAVLLLGAIRQAQERFEESSDLYGRARELLEQGGRSDPAVRASWVRACDGLAFNARARGEPATAEAVYRTALAVAPDSRTAAYFHFQLALHFQQGGRPLAALDHLEQAVRRDRRTWATRAEPIRRELRQSSPGCLTRSRSPG
jgi:tetratricopeptide (TPR) repeat protein